MATQNIKPLSSKQTREKNLVKDSYGDFWNNVKFTKGWAEPKFSRQEVDHLLELAAEIVVRIRTELDLTSPGFKLRMREGTAREFLWSIDYNPNEFPTKFVSDMVHATLQDANGYVEGLDEEKVEKKINEITEFIKEERKVLESGPKLKAMLRANLKDMMTEVEKMLEVDLFASEIPIEKAPSLKRLLQEIQDVSEEADRVVAAEREEKELKEKIKKQKEKEEQEKKEEKERREKEEAEKKRNQDELRSSQILKKIKIVAEDVNKIGSEFKILKDNADTLKLEELVSNPKATHLIENLQKRCSQFTGSLMNDLIALDQIVGNESAREARKQQVKTVQHIMDEVDAVNSKLQKLLQQLKVEKEKEKEKVKEEEKVKEKVKEEEKEKPKQRSEQPQPQKAQPEQPKPKESPKQKEEEEEEEDSDLGKLQLSSHALQEEGRRKERKETVMKDKWSRLKFQPKFDAHENKDSFVLVSYIPGLKSEDIKVAFSKKDRTVTIEGVRAPSEEEESVMKQKIKQMILKEYGNAQVSDEDLELLLVKFAVGRYGRFSETYRILKNVDLERLTADYQGGVLQVTIPKVYSPPQSPRPRPAAFGGVGRGAPVHHDFFDDRDFWW